MFSGGSDLCIRKANPAPVPRRKIFVREIQVGRILVLITDRYIKALEERIAFLEARVPDQSQDHFAIHISNHARVPSGVPQHVQDNADHESRRQNQELHQELSTEDPECDRDSLVNGVAYLSLCASGTAEDSSEPYYVGTSSGATIARLIQTSMFKGAGEHRATTEAIGGQRRQSTRAMTPPSPSLSIDSSMSSLEFPPLERSSMLFETFFDRIHTRWPVLDREIYQKLFNRQYEHGGLSIVECSIFHLIYAIAARFLLLTRKVQSVDPEVRHQLTHSEKTHSAFIASPSSSNQIDGLHTRTAQSSKPAVSGPSWRA